MILMIMNNKLQLNQHLCNYNHDYLLGLVLLYNVYRYILYIYIFIYFIYYSKLPLIRTDSALKGSDIDEIRILQRIECQVCKKKKKVEW